MPEVLETSDEAVSSGFSDASGSGFPFFLLNLEKKPFFFGGSSEASAGESSGSGSFGSSEGVSTSEADSIFCVSDFSEVSCSSFCSSASGTSAGFISSRCV